MSKPSFAAKSLYTATVTGSINLSTNELISRELSSLLSTLVVISFLYDSNKEFNSLS